jgi:hypothetical protein
LQGLRAEFVIGDNDTFFNIGMFHCRIPWPPGYRARKGGGSGIRPGAGYPKR